MRSSLTAALLCLPLVGWAETITMPCGDYWCEVKATRVRAKTECEKLQGAGRFVACLPPYLVVDDEVVIYERSSASVSHTVGPDEAVCRNKRGVVVSCAE